MFYSKFYKKYYPFKSPTDITTLNDEERALLIEFIKKYPPRATEAIHRAWKNGCKVDAYPVPKGRFFKKNLISRNKELADIAVELRQQCNELIPKIKGEKPFEDGDLANVNLILYSNKYCPVLTWFVFPTP